MAFALRPTQARSAFAEPSSLIRVRRNDKNLFPARPYPRSQAKTDESDGPEVPKVRSGTREYYEGFVSRSIDDEPADRVTGDSVLGPTLKLAGGTTLVLAAFFFAFLASNGLIGQ
eukprot:CAMPEP_0183327136 /NCGR_PEP_ID=MMETSP0160_2-20130417/83607_1 /TAXON_ID=2839 ORGANISM="Odontella Sinensis, Strain Grunow 1884" /NCGR_SAMPLE_ID=MMETSP0160_2 /ASSEMBLY_ACC=CAM_ASM_000250 /LENGTH=114 /DNA_ID=CAMNT_0025495257 /DNA_START=93 /DNA_END=437 /DNA_ORIENTATION=+